MVFYLEFPYIFHIKIPAFHKDAGLQDYQANLFILSYYTVKPTIKLW